MRVVAGKGYPGPAPEVLRAEQALHQRAGLACEAATAAGLAGRFRAWDHGGLLTTVATDPALAFVSTISGVTPQTAPWVVDLVGDSVWSGVSPTVSVATDQTGVVGQALSAAGLVRGRDRVLAVRQLDAATVVRAAPGGVVDAAGDPRFVTLLLAGYELDGPVAEYIAAEHRPPDVRGFIAVEAGTPAGAAAMTVHGQVAVLGGASTLPGHRRRGVQSRLIEHRVQKAIEAGCTLAVATARPDSVSETNLNKAGFRVHRLTTWTTPSPSARE